MGKFKKGLFFGSVLGAGMMWLGTTKKGREVREKVLDQAADVYVELKKQVMASDQYKKMTKNEYIKMVREAVDKYAIDNGLAENVKNMILKVVSSQWQNLRCDLSGKCENKCNGRCKSKKK